MMQRNAIKKLLTNLNKPELAYNKQSKNIWNSHKWIISYIEKEKHELIYATEGGIYPGWGKTDQSLPGWGGRFALPPLISRRKEGSRMNLVAHRLTH